MSNFAFLDTPEWADLYRAALKAEQYTRADPRTSLFYSRRAVELLVNWLYAADPTLRPPYDDSLAALMADADFKRLVPYGVAGKMHALRKMGNQAVHRQQQFKSSEALQMVGELFHVAHWFARTYTSGMPGAVPDQFDKALIPPPPALKQRQTRRALLALDARLKEQDAELRRAQQENAALKAQLAALQAETAKQKLVNAELPDTHDYTVSEAETRRLLIDVDLRQAGWDPEGPNVAEYRVQPMPNAQGHGFADYVLWGDDGLPLAVIEAKKTSVAKEQGKQQAALYADALEAMHGQRPVIFYTNGYEIALWDDTQYPPRPVAGYYTKDQLQLLIQRRTTQKPLAEVAIDEAIVDRYYQKEAIRRLTERFEQSHRRGLLVMATGTGKTRTAVALVDLLLRANRVKRVLFLADRNALVNQAVRAFKTHLPASSPVNLVEDKEARESRVVVSTYPTIMNQIDAADADGQRLFSPGHFDLIIIDEAHRSVYQKYGAIFTYFDSLLLGLTATPKDEVDRNTYDLFGLEQGVPTYAYGLEEAVADGYLVPPVLLETDTRFLREGIHYDDLSPEEQEEWDRIEWDDEGNIPDAVDPAALNQWLFNADTVDEVLAALMANGLKVAGGDRIGKTIIFAKNQKHAAFIEQRFDANYPHLAGKRARVVHSGVNYVQSLIDDFAKAESDPMIAVSVDMLDTGIDVPEVVNLVIFKLIRSRTKFWQMIGRGTRLRPDLFGPRQDKTHFLVFDFCGNFEFFRANPGGKPEGKLPPPLRERLFVARLDLLAALGNQPADPAAAALRQSLADTLHAQVAAMNGDNFLVRPARQHVDPFRQRERWDTLSQQELSDLAHHVAGLPTELEEETEPAKRFDLLIHQLQLALLGNEEKAVELLRARVVEAAQRLAEKGAIPAVRAQLGTLQALQEEAFWANPTPEQLDDVRKNIRGLVRFIERAAQKVLYTDFDDLLGELKPTNLTGSGAAGVNVAQYRKKVEQFLREHDDYVVMHKIRWAIPLTPEDLEALEDFLWGAEEIGSPDDFARAFERPKNLAAFIRSLVGLDRRAAKAKFNAFLEGPYTADQIRFIDHIIDYLTRNGRMEPELLYEQPYTDFHYAGVDGVFGDEEAGQVVKILREINDSVDPDGYRA